MKKITEKFQVFIFAIVLLMSFNVGFANGIDPEVKIINTEKKIFKLEVEASNASAITIRIMGKQGGILLEENLTTSQLASKSYDLSKLPKGAYEIVLENAISYSKQLVEVTYDGLEILESKPRKTFKPHVKAEGNFIYLNHLALGNQNIKVSIFDSSDNKVYSENFENARTIHKRFDVAALNDDVAYVKIKTDENTFNYRLHLR